jgi:hypothetical protein
MRLGKKDIKEALSSVPMDVVLLGSLATKGEKKLTPQEREFARAIALGESKAGAYRKANPRSTAKKDNQSRQGSKWAKKPHIQTQVEAIQAAMEAQKYQTPTHLRALVIHQLTQAALNEDFPPATRVQALKALGTVTEVAAFTERREVVKVTNAEDAKEKLLATLRLAMQSNAVDVDASELLAELDGGSMRNAAGDEGATPTPQALSDAAGNTTHSISHNQSHIQFDPPPPSKTSTSSNEDVIENTPPIKNGSPKKDGV